MEALLKHFPVGNTIHCAISISEFADHGVMFNHFIMLSMNNCI